jgi:GNAT superfamily N-acetyltransferase
MSTFQAIEPAKRASLAPLFANHRPSFLIDTVLEGHAGTALADDANDPHVAQLAYADIIIYGGDARHPLAQELAKALPLHKGVLPAPGGWRDLLSLAHGECLVAIERFAFSCEKLNIEQLCSLRQAPEGFCIKRIDLGLARQIAADSDLISEDHVRNFNSPQDFCRRGVGFCVLHRDRIVSGASSYATCHRGIELQVNTHPDFRQRGLATMVSAALLTHCLERGIEAHWDAGNPTSARLAEKLGYTLAGTYEMLLRIEPEELER